MSIGVYDIGTATVAQNGTIVTFANGASLETIKVDDKFMGIAPITAVDKANLTVTLKAPGWLLPALNASPYHIAYLPPAVMLDSNVRMLMAALSTGDVFDASGVTIQSAATCDIGAAASSRVTVQGTNTITSFGTKGGKLRYVMFAGALTLTHNAVTLALYGNKNRITAAGDRGLYMSDAAGNWLEVGYCRAASDPGDMATKSGIETQTNKTFSGDTNFPGGRITSDGKLGIKKTNPANDCDVNGSIGAGSIVANAGLGYNNPAFFRPVGDDLNWAFGSYNVGSEYYMQVTYGDTGTNELRGFRVFDNTSSNTVFSTGILKTYIRGNLVIGATTANSGAKLDVAGNIYPHTTNSHNLGAPAFVFANAYFQNAATITSDRTLKDHLKQLSVISGTVDLDEQMAALVRVGVRLSKLVTIYKMRAAIAEKGEDVARWHIGWIAQPDAMTPTLDNVVSAFEAEGLNAFQYGCVGFDLATKTVTKTRMDRRQKVVKKTRRVERINVADDGTQTLVIDQEPYDEPVWLQDSDGNDIIFELTDASGNPVKDAEGNVRTYKKPVYEDVPVPYDETVPDLDTTGQQKKIHVIRTAEIEALVIAGLNSRLDVFETSQAA